MLRSLVRQEPQQYPAWPSIEKSLEANRELERSSLYYSSLPPPASPKDHVGQSQGSSNSFAHRAIICGSSLDEIDIKGEFVFTRFSLGLSQRSPTIERYGRRDNEETPHVPVQGPSYPYRMCFGGDTLSTYVN